MSNINRVTISGNLTRDPEIRTTASGSAILAFSVAVNERRKNAQTDSFEDVANYVGCVMFGPGAEHFSKRLTKGAKVFVDGKLRYSQWEKEGESRSKLEVVVENLDTLGAELLERYAHHADERLIVYLNTMRLR